MNIAFFQNTFCTRALKQAIALRPHVDRLIGITSHKKKVRSFHKGFSDSIFDQEYSGISSIEDFQHIIQKENPDIVHCHNFPDSQAKLALDSRDSSKYRVIHDIHDHGTYQYQNLTPEQSEVERFVESNADGLIFVSDLSKKVLTKDRSLSDQSIVIHSKPNKQFIPDVDSIKKKKNFTLVYQGGTHSAPGHHRNYMHVFQDITAAGQRIDIYSSTLHNLFKKPQRIIYKDYKNISPLLNMHKAVRLEKLYQKLSQFHGGVSILSGENTPYQQLTIPNKIFEYAVCGLPSIVDSKFEAIRDYVIQENMGIIVDDWSTFSPDSILDMQNDIIKRQDEFCMESEIGTLVSFYRSMI
ncbi:MAG: glycosyltransferase [Candidatus Marinimicrobia bacterium]|nr:glycosyltransferase [Candidatus Neomarinimicrobiota bacterium]